LFTVPLLNFFTPYGPVPLYGLFKPVLERGRRPEAELPGRPRGIKAPPGLPVRLGRIPCYLPLKTRKPRYEEHEVLYGNLKAGPEVHRGVLLVPFGCEQYALCRVLGVEELAGGRAGAPDGYGRRTRVNGVHAFFYKRRDDVR